MGLALSVNRTKLNEKHKKYANRLIKIQNPNEIMKNIAVSLMKSLNQQDSVHRIELKKKKKMGEIRPIRIPRHLA